LVERSRLKPSSLVELSIHFTLIWFVLTAMAVSPVGAAGGWAADVEACEVFELGELPSALLATT